MKILSDYKNFFQNLSLIFLAGTPATIVFSFTSLTTTDPAAIMEPFPILIPFPIKTLDAIHTSSSIIISLICNLDFE